MSMVFFALLNLFWAVAQMCAPNYVLLFSALYDFFHTYWHELYVRIFYFIFNTPVVAYIDLFAATTCAMLMPH